MSKIRWAAAVSLISILPLTTGGWARANGPASGTSPRQNTSAEQSFNRKPFTADMVVRMGGEKGESHHGKIYAGDHAMRMEMEMRPGMKSTIIVRYDKKVVWMLMPGRQQYMEMPISPRAGLMTALRDKNAKVERQDLGPEKAGQYECEKYRFHTTSQGHESSGLVWIASSGAAKGFIVRTEDERSGAISEFSYIQPGQPAASLFELPAGYQKIEMPAMPGMPHD